MADGCLFIGWGDVVRGREHQALEIFNEDLQFYADLQKQKEIESFEVVFLDPHGGDLGGFILVKGDVDRLARLRNDNAFQKRMIRAALYVDNLGVVGGLMGARITTGLADYQEALSKVKSAVGV